MDGETDKSSVEKLASLPILPPAAVLPDERDEDGLAISRTVAFPGQSEVYEEKIHHGHLRPRGVEMKREMTKEDKELAAAGYEHLEEEKAKEKEDEDMDKVDITEHRLSFAELSKAFETSIDTKNPGGSSGLTSEDAKNRLARDGSNVLTPPKKKSAFRKVCPLSITHTERD